MDAFVKAMPWIVGALMVLVALLALHRPLKWIIRLLGRACLWLGALFLFSPVGGFLGVSLGVNLINALVLGLLGAPGFGLLLMVNWALAL